MSNPSEFVFKLFRHAEWQALCAQGVWQGSPDDARDGFIHLSAAKQIAGTLEKHFAGDTDLVLAAVRVADLADALKWEPSRGGALFPHLFAPLNRSSVVADAAVPDDRSGREAEIVSQMLADLMGREMESRS
jgi:uncharacterized protein (DUF952 family)